MTPIKVADALRAAVIAQRRVRVSGTIVETGDGYSGSYRNRWLRIHTAGVSVRVTASNFSPLGTAGTGVQVDLAVTMTGLADLSADVYYGERAQLIDIGFASDQPELTPRPTS